MRKVCARSIEAGLRKVTLTKALPLRSAARSSRAKRTAFGRNYIASPLLNGVARNLIPTRVPVSSAEAFNRSPVPVLVDVGSHRGGCASGAVVVGKSRGRSRGRVCHGGGGFLPCHTQTVVLVCCGVTGIPGVVQGSNPGHQRNQFNEWKGSLVTHEEVVAHLLAACFTTALAVWGTRRTWLVWLGFKEEKNG